MFCCFVSNGGSRHQRLSVLTRFDRSQDLNREPVHLLTSTPSEWPSLANRSMAYARNTPCKNTLNCFCVMRKGIPLLYRDSWHAENTPIYAENALIYAEDSPIYAENAHLCRKHSHLCGKCSHLCRKHSHICRKHSHLCGKHSHLAASMQKTLPSVQKTLPSLQKTGRSGICKQSFFACEGGTVSCVREMFFGWLAGYCNCLFVFIAKRQGGGGYNQQKRQQSQCTRNGSLGRVECLSRRECFSDNVETTRNGTPLPPAPLPNGSHSRALRRFTSIGEPLATEIL